MKDRTCLLLIDVQNALVDAKPEGIEDALILWERLLAEARSRGLLVAHVQHTDPPGEDLEPGTEGWKLAPAVQPLAGEPVFSKRYNSGFKETGLQAWLDSRGAATLVIAGMQTEHCMDATVKSAFEKGYRVIIPKDGHTTFSNGQLSGPQLRDFYENRIWKGRYAAVQPMELLVAAWTEGPEDSTG